MAVSRDSPGCRELRKWLSRLVVGVLLVWPPIHMVASELVGFSPWRLFGWGMYAAPHPESLSHVNLVWMGASAAPDDYLRYVNATVVSSDPTSCLDVLVYDRTYGPRPDPGDDPCADWAVR